MTYTRVTIFVSDTCFHVAGYHRNTFYPEGSFEDPGAAFTHALSLKVKNPDHPINVLRRIGEVTA